MFWAWRESHLLGAIPSVRISRQPLSSFVPYDKQLLAFRLSRFALVQNNLERNNIIHEGCARFLLL